MTVRTKGPGAGFGWLKQGIGMTFRHPKPLLGGAALLMVLVMLPTVIIMVMQSRSLHLGAPMSPASFGWSMAFSTLYGLLVVPLYAGYLRMLDAAERGQPARPWDIFKPYRQGEALRLVGYGVAVFVIYLAFVATVFVTVGHSFAHWYMQVLTAQAHHQPPPMTLPQGFGSTMVMFMVFALFMTGVYAISLGQIALRRRSIFGAIGDGVIGALKNALPLLVFALSAFLAMIGLLIAFGVVATLLGLLGAVVGKWLLIALTIPLYAALMLLLYAVMFGVAYCLWRDVSGDHIESGEAPSIAA